MGDMWKIRSNAYVPQQRRLAGFVIHSAKIDQLAEKKRQQLVNREDVKRLIDFDNSIQDYDQQEAMTPEQKDMRAKGWLIKTLFRTVPNEAFKMYDWMVREVKQGNITESNYRHTLDLINQATKWQQWVKEYNKREPEYNPNYMSKEFGLPELEQWVYDMNGKDLGEHDPNKVEWPDSTVLYTFPNGWHVDEVGSGDLAQEGKLMGHCVGGYCGIVESGDSVIFSLRDPKGQPHVTTEVRHDPDDKEWLIQQEQGKGNANPKSEYSAMMREFYDDFGDRHGGSVYWARDAEPEEEYREGAEGHGEDFNIDNRDELENYYDILKTAPHQFKYDEEPEYEEDAYGRPKRIEYMPRGLTVNPDALKDMIAKEAREYIQHADDEPEDLEQLINQAYFALHHESQIADNNYPRSRDAGDERWEALVNSLKDELQHVAGPAQEESLFDTSPWKRTDDSDSWRPILKPSNDIKVHKILDYLDRLSEAEAPELPNTDYSGQEITYTGWNRNNPYHPQAYNKPKPSWFAEQQLRDINGVHHPDVAIHNQRMDAWLPVAQQAKMEKEKKERENQLVKLWGGPEQITRQPKYEWDQAPPTPAAAGMDEDDYSNYFGKWHDSSGALDSIRLESHLKRHGIAKTAGSLLTYYGSTLGYSSDEAKQRAQDDLAFVQ